MGEPGSPIPHPPEGLGERCPRAGVWRKRVSPRPRPRAGLALTQGYGGTRFPHPTARRRVWEDAALQRRTYFLFVCGVAAWTADVNIGYESQSLPPQRMRRPSPPPNLPPLGGGAGLPPPSGGRAGEGGRHLRCNGLPLKQGDGETRFPHPLTRWESLEGLRPHAGVWGTQVPYAPARARALPSSKNMGEPGSPIPPARRRVWEGDALTQGDGETGFPHAPPRRGMGKPGFPIPPFALGGAPPGGMDG